MNDIVDVQNESAISIDQPSEGISIVELLVATTTILNGFAPVITAVYQVQTMAALYKYFDQKPTGRKG